MAETSFPGTFHGHNPRLKMGQTKPASSNELIAETVLPIDQHPVAVYLAGLRPEGRRGIITALHLVTRTLTNGITSDFMAIDWTRVSLHHLFAVKAALKDHYAPKTVNHALTAVRKVLKTAWRLGLITEEEYISAAAVRGIRTTPNTSGRRLSAAEIYALMAVCEMDQREGGARDAAIIALMFACGMKQTELTNLTTSDYNKETGRLTINAFRANPRTVYLTNGVLSAVSDWLQVRGDKPGPLFNSMYRNGVILDHGISPQGVYDMLKRRATKAGITPITLIDFRRTYINNLLEAGADLATVSRMAGHTDINYTARYDRRSETTEENAAKLLQVPYKRR